MESSSEARRFRVALDLAETGVMLMWQNLRRRDPDASDAEIDIRLRAWLNSRPMDVGDRSDVTASR